MELESGHSEYELEMGGGGGGGAEAYSLSPEDEIYIGLLSARVRLEELMRY